MSYKDYESSIQTVDLEDYSFIKELISSFSAGNKPGEVYPKLDSTVASDYVERYIGSVISRLNKIPIYNDDDVEVVIPLVSYLGGVLRDVEIKNYLEAKSLIIKDATRRVSGGDTSLNFESYRLGIALFGLAISLE